jgi:hypothetical protein
MQLITQGKTNIKYVFIVTIIAIFAGGLMMGAFKLMKCPFWWPSVPQTTITEDETASWETYTNQIYNFEIKYPKDWMLQKEVGHPPATIISYRWEDTNYCSFNILIVSNNTDNFFSAEPDWYRQNGYTEESYTVAGMPAIKFSKFPVEDSRPAAVIYFNNNSDRIDMVTSLDKYETCTKIFSQMLSTLKFLNETVSWQTYQNKDGGYSFEYPKEWNAATNKYNSKNALFGPGATSESGYGGVEYIGTLSSGQSLKTFVKEFNLGIESGSISETATTINGQNVIINILPKASTEPTETKSVSFEKNGKVFNMYLTYKTNFTQYPEDKQRLDIFNQMLSTFKFAD